MYLYGDTWWALHQHKAQLEYKMVRHIHICAQRVQWQKLYGNPFRRMTDVNSLNLNHMT